MIHRHRTHPRTRRNGRSSRYVKPRGWKIIAIYTTLLSAGVCFRLTPAALMTPLVYDRLPFFRFGSPCLPASLFYSAISCTMHFFRYLPLQDSLRNPGDLRTCVTSNLSCVNEEKGLEKKRSWVVCFSVSSLRVFRSCFSILTKLEAS